MCAIIVFCCAVLCCFVLFLCCAVLCCVVLCCVNMREVRATIAAAAASLTPPPISCHLLSPFVCAGKSCWIATDEDGRDEQTGVAYRFGLQYAGGACVSVSLRVRPSVCLSLSVRMSVCVRPHVYLCLSVSVSVCFCLSVCCLYGGLACGEVDTHAFHFIQLLSIDSLLMCGADSLLLCVPLSSLDDLPGELRAVPQDLPVHPGAVSQEPGVSRGQREHWQQEQQ